MLQLSLLVVQLLVVVHIAAVSMGYKLLPRSKCHAKCGIPLYAGKDLFAGIEGSLPLNDDGDGLAEDTFGAAAGPLPSVSSKINFAEKTLNIKYDLWIVGAGVLSESLIKDWIRRFPNAKIAAETKSTKRHEMLSGLGCEPKLRDQRVSADSYSAKHVVIALPPSACKEKNEYYEELSEACRLWAGSKGGGGIVFTSSIGVYGESIGNIVNEDFRLDSSTSRTTR